MRREEMEIRTKKFALGVLAFVARLPKSRAADVLGHQLLRCGTSIGANYRESGRAESHADFVHKLGIVEKEASETQYWLELCREMPLGDAQTAAQLLDEATQLLAIFTTMHKTAHTRPTAGR